MFEDHHRGEHVYNQQPNGGNNNPSRRIMIINDREDINFSIKTVLEELEDPYKIRVYPFSDPYLALENFKPGLCDLILVDIRMPKMDGFELYSKIRKLDGKVKICFLTASDIPEVSRKEMFADELDEAQEKICFIKMPIANEELIKRIKEVLELK